MHVNTPKLVKSLRRQPAGQAQQNIKYPTCCAFERFAHKLRFGTAQGASEMVLQVCESVVDSSGGPVQLSDKIRKELEEAVTQMACKGLRTLCLAVRDFPQDRPAGFFDEPPTEELTLCCLVGIKVSRSSCIFWATSITSSDLITQIFSLST